LLGELHIDTKKAVFFWWQPQTMPAARQPGFMEVAHKLKALVNVLTSHLLKCQ